MICANINNVIEICGCGGTGRRAGLRNQCQRRGGSSPFNRTNNVSVRTNRTERYKINQKIKSWLIFLLFKNNNFSRCEASKVLLRRYRIIVATITIYIIYVATTNLSFEIMSLLFDE